MILTLVTTLSISSVAFAAQEPLENNPIVAQGEVVFSNLDKNPTQSYTGIGADGQEYTVGIEPIINKGRASSNSWRIYIYGPCSAEFYMTVTGNKCTRAYDWSLTAIPAWVSSWSNASLSRNTTSATLYWDWKDPVIQKRMWLRGTCTGSNNKVSVSYNM